ncbi:MAG: hypothetical protein HQ568_00425 [Calditrichaeota bacterium]|nr:hypothetical protein [Calditrichota bacterium]
MDIIRNTIDSVLADLTLAANDYKAGKNERVYVFEVLLHHFLVTSYELQVTGYRLISSKRSEA